MPLLAPSGRRSKYPQLTVKAVSILPEWRVTNFRIVGSLRVFDLFGVVFSDADTHNIVVFSVGDEHRFFQGGQEIVVIKIAAE